MSIFTMFAKQSMTNRLSNPINRNRSAAKISKVMSSSGQPFPVRDILNSKNCSTYERDQHAKDRSQSNQGI